MNQPEIVRLKNAVDERDHASGSQTAPVTLLEYGNFECNRCGRAYPVVKEIQKLLGDDLRFVFRNFPTVQTHPHAIRAAAESAATQGKFWEMHDELFTHQQALEDHDATPNESDSMLKGSRAIWLKIPSSKRSKPNTKPHFLTNMSLALLHSTLMRYAIRVRPMSIAFCWRSSKRIPKAASDFLNARRVSEAFLIGFIVV